MPKHEPLRPGEHTAASCNFTQRKGGGWSLQWRVRPLNGEKTLKYTTQGNATQAELRRRAIAKAEHVLETYGRPRTSNWKPSDDMRAYVLEQAIPDVEKKPDSVLRPRTRKRYVGCLKLYAEAARRFAIVDAAREENLTDALLRIEQEHGSASAKQTQKVVGRYVIAPLKKAHVITANEAIGLEVEYVGDIHRGKKPKGGQALTHEQRLAVIDHLLDLDPTCERGKRGHYTAEQRTAKRRLVIDATLTQATCGLRIVEVRKLQRRHIGEQDGMLTLEVTDDASKTHKGRVCFVDDARVADRIRARLRELPDDDAYVFGAPAAPGKMWDASNAQKAIRALYDELADALDIPLLRNVSSHVWRATLNTEWRDKGVLPELRAAYFGHTTETNERYYTAGVNLASLAAQVAS